MTTQLFVGGIPYSTSSDRLRELFAGVGQVESVTIAKDPGGRSRGYGFVQMATEVGAQEAVQRLDRSDFEGRRLAVAFANSRAGQARRRERPGPVGPRDPTPRDRREPIVVARHYCGACDRSVVGYLWAERGTALTERQREDFGRRLTELHARECSREPALRARREPR